MTLEEFLKLKGSVIEQFEHGFCARCDGESFHLSGVGKSALAAVENWCKQTKYEEHGREYEQQRFCTGD